jgi:hypothetical protein
MSQQVSAVHRVKCTAASQTNSFDLCTTRLRELKCDTSFVAQEIFRPSGLKTFRRRHFYNYAAPTALGINAV